MFESPKPPHFPDPDALGVRQVITMVRWLLYLAFVVIAFFVLRELAPVLTPILSAAGLAYLLDPLVDWLVARGVRRILAVGMLLITFVGSLVTAVIVLTPLMANDAASFIEELPAMLQSSSSWLMTNVGFTPPTSWLAYLEGDKASSMLQDVAGPATSLAAAALGGFFSFLGALAEILLVPVFAFYFLLDWDDIVTRMRAMIPPRHRRNVVDLIIEIDAVVSSWIRGQFTVVTIQAILYATCFYFLDVRLAITVGLLVGLLTIIPFLGTVAGAVITIALVLLDWQGAGQLLGVGAVFVILHLLEAAVLTPRIVGKRVGLGETGALFAVLAGGQLLGFAGVLLAVPIAASVAVLIRRLIRFYEHSAFFGASDRDASVPEPLTSLPAVAAAVSISLDSDIASKPAPAAAAKPTSSESPATTVASGLDEYAGPYVQSSGYQTDSDDIGHTADKDVHTSDAAGSVSDPDET